MSLPWSADLTPATHRTLRQRRARWHTARPSSSTSRPGSRWTRRSTSGCASISSSAVISLELTGLRAVARLRALRARVPALAVREPADGRARRLDRHGGHERAIQAPEHGRVTRIARAHRRNAEGRAARPAGHTPGAGDDGACTADGAVIVIRRRRTFGAVFIGNGIGYESGTLMIVAWTVS